MRLAGEHGGSGEWSTWLRNTLEVPIQEVQGNSLISVLLRLPVNLITTTNYDKVLSGLKMGAEGVTWREPNRVLEALRSGTNIVHLHGAWDDPQSVIFGWEEYEALYANEAYRHFLRTLWLSKTLVFVGCSLDGMRDPDFARLLDWAAETFPDNTVKHYALVRADTYAQSDVERFLNRWRIQLVPYGESYDDLVPYLLSFVPQKPDLMPPSPPRVFAGREEALEQLLTSILGGETILVHGIGGIGKTSLVAKAVAELEGTPEGKITLWMDGAGESALDLGRAVGRHLQVPALEAEEEQVIASRIRLHLANHANMHIVVELNNDIDHAKVFVEDYVPPGVPVTVVSRRRMPGFQNYIRVDPLDQSEAEALFCAVAGIDLGHPLVREIVEALEGHPLALTLAASRIVVEDLPLVHLRNRLSEAKSRLATLQSVDGTDSPLTSVSASLQVSFENLPDHLQQAAALLAHFHFDATSEMLALALEADVVESEDIISRLVSRSIVQRDNYGIVHLHPLVKDYVVNLVRSDSDSYGLKIEKALIDLIKEDDQDRLSRSRTVIDNYENVAHFIRGTNSESSIERIQASVVLLDELFRPHGIVDRFAVDTIGSHEKIDLIDGGLEIVGNTLAGELKVALLVCKAHVFSSERSFQRAIGVLEEAMVILDDTSMGPEHASFIKCQIANQLCELFSYSEAERVMKEGLDLAIESAKESSIAQLKGQMGMVLLRSGDLDRAKEYYQEAKDIYQRLQDFIGVAACLYNMADIARMNEEEDLAWALDCEGLEAEITAVNPKGALSSLERLAASVTTEDQLDIVLSRLGEVTSLLPRATWGAHRGIEQTIRGVAYLRRGDSGKARQNFEQALALREEAGDHRGAAVVLGHMSNLAFVSGRPDEAWDFNKRSRKMYEAANDLRGIYVCGINGISFAIHLDDPESVIDACASAVHAAALMNDLQGIVQAFTAMPLTMLTQLDMQVPDAGDLSTEEVMELIAESAVNRDMARIAGLVDLLVRSGDSRQQSIGEAL